MRQKQGRQARQRGSIKAHGPNKWLVRWFVGYVTVKGAKKRKYASEIVAGSKATASRKLTEKLNALDTDTYIEPSTMILDDFMDLWFAAKSDLAPRTLETYRHRYVKDLKAPFGDKKLSELSKMTPQIQAHINDLVKPPRKLSRSTVEYSVMILKQAFEAAIEWQYVGRNPLRRISIPRDQATESGRKQTNMDVLTPSQVANFLQWSNEHETPYRNALWTVLFTTGIRPQEAFGLTWDDLSVKDNGKVTLAINKAVVSIGKDRYEMGDTKTFQSRRTISIPQETYSALKKHRGAQLASIMASGDAYDRSLNLIFANSVGGILDISKCRKWFVAALKASKTKRIRLYDTRHSHATGLLVAGVHAKVVSERLGHKSVKITLDTYSHVIPEMSEATADVVGETFFNKAGGE